MVWSCMGGWSSIHSGTRHVLIWRRVPSRCSVSASPRLYHNSLHGRSASASMRNQSVWGSRLPGGGGRKSSRCMRSRATRGRSLRRTCSATGSCRLKQKLPPKTSRGAPRCLTGSRVRIPGGAGVGNLPSAERVKWRRSVRPVAGTHGAWLAPRTRPQRRPSWISRRRGCPAERDALCGVGVPEGALRTVA